MSIEKMAHVAYGVTIHHSETEVLKEIIRDLYLSYGEGEELPAVDPFHEDVDEVALNEDFPGLAYDVYGSLVLDGNLGLVFFIESSFVPLDVREDNQRATRLTPELLDAEGLEQIKKFAKKYGTVEPSWVAWTNAFNVSLFE